MHDVECPYCGRDVEINTDDGYGLEEDQTYQQECEDCGKTFVYTTTILIVHHAEKAECLNGAPHNMRPVTCYPPCWPDWVRCTACGEEIKGEFHPEVLDEIVQRMEASK